MLTASMLLSSQQGQPDLHLAIAFPRTRVKAPGARDWKKLGPLMKCVQVTAQMTMCHGSKVKVNSDVHGWGTHSACRHERTWRHA